jgi:hypothetical protein
VTPQERDRAKARRTIRETLKTAGNKPAPPFAVLRAVKAMQTLVQLTFQGRYRLDLVEIDGVGDEYDLDAERAIRDLHRENP